MKKWLWVSLLVAGLAWAGPQVERAAVPASPSARTAPKAVPLPDSGELEKRLQALSWPQFRAVVQAVPKLKADVDAYGAFGWQYVQVRYKTYRWKKNIDRLKDDQKRELADLIEQARAGRLPAQPVTRKN